ncbi:MAG: riboflavin synthase [Chitinophagaceae bacterium]|jgi:riboflavin synthase|nr:riboflavin synthase [Chitinophagaceae bacterium]
MFTGIIETTGKVTEIITAGGNKSFWVESAIGNELKIDQSLSHDGVCLTVDALNGNLHRVTAIEETLAKSNLSLWQPNRRVNLERCVPISGRLDGHIVQGHVDTVAICTDKKILNGSWEYTFEYPKEFMPLVIDKGSIAVNGTSLTAFNVQENFFTVAIIPYTYEHTTIQYVEKNTIVNIEFDIIGKYILRKKMVNSIMVNHSKFTIYH